MKKKLAVILVALIALVSVGFVGCSGGDVGIIAHQSIETIKQSQLFLEKDYLKLIDVITGEKVKWDKPVTPSVGSSIGTVNWGTLTPVPSNVNPMTGQPYGVGPVKDLYNSTFR